MIKPHFIDFGLNTKLDTRFQNYIKKTLKTSVWKLWEFWREWQKVKIAPNFQVNLHDPTIVNTLALNVHLPKIKFQNERHGYLLV